MISLLCAVTCQCCDKVSGDVLLVGVECLVCVLFPHFVGLNGAESLHNIEKGYRMPQPNTERFECPHTLYEMMLKTWEHIAEDRPTFAYLYSFFDDYFIATEPNYRETF